MDYEKNIGIIGVGKLGLVFALLFEKAGLNVVASSYKSEYVENLNKKIVDTVEPGVRELLESSTNIHFTVDNHEVISKCNIIYIMVATPSLGTGEYDMSALDQVKQDFQSYKGDIKNKIFIVGCTTNPGVCDNIDSVLKPLGVHVVYCPTFSAQGNVVADIQKPIKLLLGVDNTDVATICDSVFSKIIAKDTDRCVVSRKAAEIVKLAGNCLATTMITYNNLVGQILLNSGLEEDVAASLATINLMNKKTDWSFGFGYGGPCYPRDNRSLVHYANKVGVDNQIGTVVDNLNQNHHNFLLKFYQSKNVNNLPFYFAYISYKKGVNIFEESQQLKLCKDLLKNGHKVYVNPTKFLLSSIINELVNEYQDRIEFISIDDLTAQGIDVYQVNFDDRTYSIL